MFSFSAGWMLILENVKLRNGKMCHVMVYNKGRVETCGETYILQAAGVTYVMLVRLGIPVFVHK